ncbi:hypothetical protein [Sphingorhabdus sp. SMR4y]|uniref:DUF7946 domain-containing protein n=1 Tax=Sphingorhabdus sp. SMR4y TaxID=2584094 RepID=UPI000B5FB191|nr:hypothetical protein [Sphingorhabdus sp. SMR4y]ASK90128.1 hypothetical protein SPHFLASMR4Y_03402 [Sphingorhabdus sp. SMR4y]
MLVLKYDGMDAQEHRLDALSGGESLAGFGHTLTLISHFNATGQIRFRAPYSRDFRCYFVASQKGSLEWLIQTISNNPEAVALGFSANGFAALVGYICRRAIGDPPGEFQDIEHSTEISPGDLDALVEAVEPSLRRAHRVIGRSASDIMLQREVSSEALVRFDERSREYLEHNVNAGVSTQDVSINSLNVNSRYGRAYFGDLGRTIAFKIDRDASYSTLTALSSALDDYAKRKGLTVNIKFTRIEAPDGRLKRIIIHDADQLDADNL